jgi:hypothetical protein
MAREQKYVLFQATSGISPIDAINVNSFSNSQRIGVDICSGCIRPEKGMDNQSLNLTGKTMRFYVKFCAGF